MTADRSNSNNNNDGDGDGGTMIPPHNKIQCHYDVLGIPRDADAATIKKHHRKMALLYHPDKNFGNDVDVVAEKFRLVQQAYECLSDPQERAWYDDHRDAILAGWSSRGGDGNDDLAAAAAMLFDVVPFMHAGCYSGYHTEMGGFYHVYQQVFERIVCSERKQSDISIDLPTDFGSAYSDWAHVRDFYQRWESFSSVLNFAWEDKYNAHEDAPNRRIRRMMDDENKKARRAGKKVYNNDIIQLIAFVKRRDPRVKAKLEEQDRLRKEQDVRERQMKLERKIDQQKAKEAWRETAMREMEATEEEDRLAGRVRLADLEDDYDYGGGKKKKGKKKKKKQSFIEDDEPIGDDGVGEATTVAVAPSEQTSIESGVELEAGDECDRTTSEDDYNSLDQDGTVEDDDQEAVLEQKENGISDETTSQHVEEDFDNDESDDDEEDEPDIWRCECCRKDFKSEGQMVNHMKSKKHKEAFKKYQAKAKTQQDDEDIILAQMMDEVELES